MVTAASARSPTLKVREKFAFHCKKVCFVSYQQHGTVLQNTTGHWTVLNAHALCASDFEIQFTIRLSNEKIFSSAMREPKESYESLSR